MLILQQIQYNITLLPSVNTLIARGMVCGAKYSHHTFTPIIKHLLQQQINIMVKSHSYIYKNMKIPLASSCAYHIKLPLPEDPIFKLNTIIKCQNDSQTHECQSLCMKHSDGGNTWVPVFMHETSWWWQHMSASLYAWNTLMVAASYLTLPI